MCVYSYASHSLCVCVHTGTSHTCVYSYVSLCVCTHWYMARVCVCTVSCRTVCVCIHWYIARMCVCSFVSHCVCTHWYIMCVCVCTDWHIARVCVCTHWYTTHLAVPFDAGSEPSGLSTVSCCVPGWTQAAFLLCAHAVGSWCISAQSDVGYLCRLSSGTSQHRRGST